MKTRYTRRITWPAQRHSCNRLTLRALLFSPLPWRCRLSHAPRIRIGFNFFNPSNKANRQVRLIVFYCGQISFQLQPLLVYFNILIFASRVCLLQCHTSGPTLSLLPFACCRQDWPHTRLHQTLRMIASCVSFLLASFLNRLLCNSTLIRVSRSIVTKTITTTSIGPHRNENSVVFLKYLVI